MLVKRDRYKAVTTQLPLLMPALPGEAGGPAAFLPAAPGSRLLRVRTLSFEEAQDALLQEAPRHSERKHYAGVVALLQAIQSGNREAQELAVQRLIFPPSQDGRDIVQKTISTW
jgi:hypothetical protein